MWLLIKLFFMLARNISSLCLVAVSLYLDHTNFKNHCKLGIAVLVKLSLLNETYIVNHHYYFYNYDVGDFTLVTLLTTSLGFIMT